MKRRRLALDLVFALVAVLLLLAPLLQFALVAQIELAEAQKSRRFTQVCNVEGSLCVIAAGTTTGRPFGRLLPGH